MQIASILLTIFKWLWPSPYTLFGMAIGGLGLVTGGSVRVREGVLGFYGGATTWIVRRMPLGGTTMAVTFGHTVLAQNLAFLNLTHQHELVHVRQYERWGIFMGPAYLLCSAVLWMKGKQAYLDNPFEVEAYAEDSRRLLEREIESN